MGELLCGNCGYPKAYSDFSRGVKCSNCGTKFPKEEVEELDDYLRRANGQGIGGSYRRSKK